MTKKTSPKAYKAERVPAKVHSAARRFYSGHFTAEEAGLMAEFAPDPSLDDEVWLQRVLNHRLLEYTQLDDVELLIKVVHGLGTGAGRVAKLLRDKRALSGEAANSLAAAIAAALNEIGKELGLPL